MHLGRDSGAAGRIGGARRRRLKVAREVRIDTVPSVRNVRGLGRIARSKGGDDVRGGIDESEIAGAGIELETGMEVGESGTRDQVCPVLSRGKDEQELARIKRDIGEAPLRQVERIVGEELATQIALNETRVQDFDPI